MSAIEDGAMQDKDSVPSRPKDSNADAWHLFLSEWLDARALFPNGLKFMAVQIAEAIDDAAEILKDKDGEQVDDLVKRMRYESLEAPLMDDAADALVSQSAELTRLRERNAELEKALVKSWTIIHWAVGEGIILEPPYYDPDDTFIELCFLLGAQDWHGPEDARAAIADFLKHVAGDLP